MDPKKYPQTPNTQVGIAAWKESFVATSNAHYQRFSLEQSTHTAVLDELQAKSKLLKGKITSSQVISLPTSEYYTLFAFAESEHLDGSAAYQFVCTLSGACRESCLLDSYPLWWHYVTLWIELYLAPLYTNGTAIELICDLCVSALVSALLRCICSAHVAITKPPPVHTACPLQRVSWRPSSFETAAAYGQH